MVQSENRLYTGRRSEIPLYEPRSWRKMHLATYTSGTCLNIQNILEFQLALEMTGKEWAGQPGGSLPGCPFMITEMFSNAETKRAPYLGRKYDVRHSLIPDPPADQGTDERWNYDRKMARILSRRPIDFFFFGGTASRVSQPFIRTFKNRIIAVNIGDLTSRDENGRYRFFGQRSVLKTIMCGHRVIRISVFFLQNNHIPGAVLEIADPLPMVDLDQIGDFPFDTYRRMNAVELEAAALDLQKQRVAHQDFFRIVYTNVERAIRLRGHFTLARVLLDLSLGRYYQNKAGYIFKKG